MRIVGYGSSVPGHPREHVTTDELLAVAESSRATLYEWVARRLLPRPRIVTGPGGEQFAVWPTEALARVRLIVEKIGEGMSMDDVAALIEERWPRP